MDADKILQSLGAYGRYQGLVFVALCFVYMRGAWHVLASLFIAADPGHHCSVPSNVSLNMSLPGEDTDGDWTPDKCKMYVPGTLNNTQRCTNGWTYGEEFKSTIVTEWDLVCDNEYLVELSTTTYLIGNTLGALFLTPLSDRFGRKRTILFMLWVQLGFAVGTSFSNTYILFCVMRFFVGLLNMPIALTTYVMMTELFPSSHRAIASVAVNCFWSVGIILLAVFAYFLRDWSYLYLVITIPNAVTFFYYWFLPESIPWLVAKGKVKQTESVAKFAAKLNGIRLPPDLFSVSPDTEQHADSAGQSSDGLVLDETHTEKTKYNILDLFKTPKLRRYTLIMFYLWLANSLSYFGILFATPTLSGNQFLNFGISGAVEIPALVICIAAMQSFGRRLPHIFFLFLCGVTNIAVIFVPDKTADGTDLSPLVTTLAMIGKFGITGSYSVAYLYSSEIFPTVLRNHAVGLSSFFENIGTIAAPLVVYAAQRNQFQKFPLVVFGIISLVGSFLCYFLPETHKCALPETIEDVERMGQRMGQRKQRGNDSSHDDCSSHVCSSHL